jgi:predicted HTH transcriptional regulator
MTLREIQTSISSGENQMLEFKKKVAHPEKIVREVVAFANSNGGELYIGVDDNGTISGLKFAEEDQFALEKAIQKYCKPKINFKSEIIKISEKKAIVRYTIFESPKKPHYVIENNKGKAYVRVEDKSVQASREIREILRRSRSGKNVKFHFGEKEKLLMQYLQVHEFITIKKFALLAGISNYMASRTLILLVLANVLKVIPRENEDWYALAG